MAITRFGENSDVFVTVATDGHLECNACRLNNRGTYAVRDKKAMVEHLEDHMAAGHKVPPEAFEDLTRRPKW